MIKVALTGGIGAGKTTIAHIFESLGVPVYYSDFQAKILMATLLRNPLTELLGTGAFSDDGTLNRDYISSAIFGEPALLKKINSLVHPAVKADFLLWANKQNAPYVIIETALLLESSLDEIVDTVIVVTAPLDIRIERASLRDNVSAGKICQRLASQSSQEDLLKICNYQIDTSPRKMQVPSVVYIDTKLRGVGNCKK